MTHDNYEPTMQTSQWPGEVHVEDLRSESGLTPEQDARCTALIHARRMLSDASPGGLHTPSVSDLLRVAQWIMGEEFSD